MDTEGLVPVDGAAQQGPVGTQVPVVCRVHVGVEIRVIQCHLPGETWSQEVETPNGMTDLPAPRSRASQSPAWGPPRRERPQIPIPALPETVWLPTCGSPVQSFSKLWVGTQKWVARIFQRVPWQLLWLLSHGAGWTRLPAPGTATSGVLVAFRFGPATMTMGVWVGQI